MHINVSKWFILYPQILSYNQVRDVHSRFMAQTLWYLPLCNWGKRLDHAFYVRLRLWPSFTTTLVSKIFIFLVINYHIVKFLLIESNPIPPFCNKKVSFDKIYICIIFSICFWVIFFRGLKMTQDQSFWFCTIITVQRPEKITQSVHAFPLINSNPIS